MLSCASLKRFDALELSHRAHFQAVARWQPQDLTWQKSFDSYQKREHLRLWSQPVAVNGQQAWLGAYTRETGAALSIKYHKFIHHIDPDVDQGVVMMVRDLTLAGCVQSVGRFPRSQMLRHVMNSTGDELDTDGVLDVVQLQSCARSTVEYTLKNPLIPFIPAGRSLDTSALKFFYTRATSSAEMLSMAPSISFAWASSSSVTTARTPPTRQTNA